jgi:hypothetical protein
MRAEEDRALIYFYFDFSDPKKQSFEAMMKSLIKQLYLCSVKARKPLVSAFSLNHESQDSETLQKIFLEMLEASQQEVWIVLDALDECNMTELTSKTGLLAWITSFINSTQAAETHLLMTSRPEQDIRSEMLAAIPDEPRRICLQNSKVDMDIRSYICDEVRGRKRLKKWSNFPGMDVQKMIEDKLVQKAKGM